MEPKHCIKGSCHNAFYTETIQISQDRFGQGVEIAAECEGIGLLYAISKREDVTARNRSGNIFWEVYSFIYIKVFPDRDAAASTEVLL